MGRRRDDVGVAERGRVDARGDQARVVGHVDHQQGAHGVRDLGEALEVDLLGVGRGARHDELRMVLVGEALDGVHVDLLALVEAVGDRVEVLAREVEVHAVREVAAVGEREPHERVAGLQDREEDRGVGLGARVRLHVDGHLDAGGLAEELLGALDREALDLVDEFAAAVVALAGIALGVLVGEAAALGGHDGRRGVVLARDELDVLLLALRFSVNPLPQIGILLGGAFGCLEHEKSSA